jgi:uncharacterized protein YutE (UPF0331/DUF86 family)
MIRKDQLAILDENVNALQDSIKWLKRSFRICDENYKTETLSDEAMDAFEGLTSRFSRVVDILYSKVFRSITYLEKGESLSWIDSLLLMEKIGIITSTEDARLIKELRNDIVHEYLASDMAQLYQEVLEQCPVLFNYADLAIERANLIKNKLGT